MDANDEEEYLAALAKARAKAMTWSRVMTKDGSKFLLTWSLGGEPFAAFGENLTEVFRLATQLTDDYQEALEKK